MPRRTRWQFPEEPDYSPNEVAEGGWLGIGRAAIYRQIKRGLIKTIKEDGYERITQSEIERLRRVRNIKTLMKGRDKSSPEIERLKHEIQVESGRIGGRLRSARHSKEEIAEWFAHGRREKWIEQIDPRRTLPPADLERRLEAIAEAQLAQARKAKHERQLLRELQHRYDQHP